MDSVTFLVDGKKIQCNKNIVSRFFKCYSDVISIPNVNYHAFVSLIDYIYWRKINVTINNVEMILVAAIQCEIQPVVKLCEDVMIINTTPINCMKVFMFSKRYNLETLSSNTVDIIRRNINTVIHFPEFMDISCSDLKMILCHVDVNIQHEDMTAFVLLKWLSKNRYDTDILEILHKNFMSNTMIECLDALSLPVPSSSLPITRREIMQHVIVIEEDTVQTLYPTIDIYSPRLKNWNVVNRMLDISAFNIAVLGNCLYVVGGVSRHRFVRYIMCLDLITKEWKQCIELTFPRKYVGVGVNNGNLYVVGGEDEFTNSSINIVECWRPGNRYWKRLSNMKTTKAIPSVVFLENIMYVIGGINISDGYIFALSEMDCLTRTGWVSKAPIPRACNVSTTVHDGYIYAITRFSINYTNDLFKYSPKDNSWTLINTYFGENMKASICVYDNDILVLGGERGYMYDTKTNTWKISNCVYKTTCKCISFCYDTPFRNADTTSINTLLKSVNEYSFKKMIENITGI
ncbi:POZ/BTB kelch domain protein [NY_014 poxvirus]|uniref:POZ/BTB kelch domain protein n=1 Tax=NY_014 poxvirus TaxID=2025360 RepID=UPI000B9A0919|nr:POZ/BTB kelch domain protein [NY_014 poxvirus]AST09421.1 POZ/BTB kelch domain protein [NY_014 poxvirus]